MELVDVIDILIDEKTCVERNIAREHGDRNSGCDDRNCRKCDLLHVDEDILGAYDYALNVLCNMLSDVSNAENSESMSVEEKASRFDALQVAFKILHSRYCIDATQADAKSSTLDAFGAYNRGVADSCKEFIEHLERWMK